MKDQVPGKVFYMLQNVLTEQILKSFLQEGFQEADPYMKVRI